MVRSKQPKKPSKPAKPRRTQRPSRQVYAGAPGSAPTKTDKRFSRDVEAWVNTGRWVRVISSNVEYLKYYKAQWKLYVRFKSGDCYEYSGVAPRVARDFYHATSMGKFLHWRIKTRGYAYRPVEFSQIPH